MSAIYRVFGQRGEYSDFNEWSVRAFTDEAEAGRYKVACELEYAKVKKLVEELNEGKDPYGHDSWVRREEIVSNFDPAITGASCGSFYEPTYGVETIELGWPS